MIMWWPRVVVRRIESQKPIWITEWILNNKSNMCVWLYCKINVKYKVSYQIRWYFLSNQHWRWALVISTGVTLYQGGPGPSSRSTKGTSRAPYMHEFSSGSRACSPGKFLNLDSLKCHFPDSGERFYRILMVRERHCCSIGYSLSLGAPIGVGGPRVLPVPAHSSRYATGYNYYGMLYDYSIYRVIQKRLSCANLKL